MGLTASSLLKTSGIQHVVLERSQIANTWRTQRWNSFNLVLPNWTLRLPKNNYAGNDPDGFLDLKSTIEYIENFAEKQKLPIRTGVDVLKIEKLNSEYRLHTSHGIWLAENLIIASGSYNKPRIPAFAKNFPENIQQIHSSEYRDPTQFGPGAVLVVGTGQSGTQIAEELHSHGKKVFLSVSRCGSRPRRYRGKDCVWWMDQRGFYNQTLTNPSDKRRHACNVPLTGFGGGHDIDLHEFAEKGIQLVGRLVQVKSQHIELAQDLTANLQFADAEWNRFLQECDAFTEKNNLNFPLETQAYKTPDRFNLPMRTELDFAKESITGVIWSTGFEPCFPQFDFSVLDESGYPVQVEGRSNHKGLYFLGLPWLRKRQSSIFLGSTEDAELVVADILKSLQK